MKLSIGTLFENKDRCSFEQNSAPIHKAKIAEEWFVANIAFFIEHRDWDYPCSSLDFNPLDY